MIIHTIPPTSLPSPASPLIITAEPFTREAFAPFGQAISNPRPDLRPPLSSSSSSSSAVAVAEEEAAAGFGAVPANQGSAIQYRALASIRELYGQAPSARRATPRLTMFVCGARQPEPGGEGEGEGGNETYRVAVLERHPFTSQTFIPLAAGAEARYLVVVAPTRAADSLDADADADAGGALPVPVPVPSSSEEEEKEEKRLPGPGLPDVRALRAFVASGAQAVTYGPGTWHAPMMALGPRGSALDFLVVQFANDVPLEDCQEVVLGEGEGKGEGEKEGVTGGARVLVRLPNARGEEEEEEEGGRGGAGAKL
ncbi:ureidoglycolate hydrolase [Biscogniauxia mediterranea]|nr:ureidoglycolate hydrolase [Biscogniauxia mediterranea]